MSEASTIARPAHGMPAAINNKHFLLNHMKLKAPNDLFVHEKIEEWVSFQKIPSQIHPARVPACRRACALLLQRLVRAFENRLNTSSDDAKKAKVSAAVTNRSNPASTTNGNFVAAKRSPSKVTSHVRATRKLPSLQVLMQRKVKVTQLVQQAVQYIGSDVLKVLQFCPPSPTVADIANVSLKFMNDENRIRDFYRVFSEASGKEPSSSGESSAIFFGVFALQSLQSLRAQAISAYEFSHDFEMIYRTCYQDPTFQICMHELNPTMRSIAGTAPAGFAPDTEARNICWKLARLLALKFDHNHKSDPEAKDHRRNHILLSASSIILAANIGKSIRNGDFSSGASSSRKEKIPDDIDFVALVAAPVSELLSFLVKNLASSNQGITPICEADIRCHVTDICVMINKLGLVAGVSNSNVPSSLSSSSLLSRLLTPAKHYAIINDYRKIIQSLVRETQKELRINASNTNHGRGSVVNVKTGIVNVLLFFPMVIGEPWGIHRDSPMITSTMLCSGEHSKPSSPLEDSVAVVLKMKPKPKPKKRNVAAVGSFVPGLVQTGNKKAKTIAPSEFGKKTTTNSSQETINLLGKDHAPQKQPSPNELGLGESDSATLDDLAELNEWTLSVLSLSVIKPADSLLTYLGEHDRMRGSGSCLQDVIVPVLNRGVLRIQSSIRSSNNQEAGVTKTKLAIGRKDGQVYVNGAVDQNIQLSASIVGFYYCSLEAIIQDQMERMEFLGSFSSQLQSGAFHRALLACSYLCVLKGVGMNQNRQLIKNKGKITLQVLMDTVETESFMFLKVAEAFFRANVTNNKSAQKELRFPIVAGLPVILHDHLQKIESQLIDSVLWYSPRAADGSLQASFALTIKTMKSLPGAWPPDILEPMLPEEIAEMDGDFSKTIEPRYKPSFGASSEANFLSFVLRKLLKSVFKRIRAICAALDLSSEKTLHTQILVAFRYLLRHHISIFNNRHVDQLLLSTIYGICRVMKIEPKITFRKVIDAYFSVRGQELGELTCRFIVRHIKLTSSGIESQASSQASGNIITFYNTVYIPKMQKYFFGSKSLKKSAELYQLSLKKETSKEKATSAKKTASTKVPNATSGSAESGPVVAVSHTSQSAKSQTNSTSLESYNKTSTRKELTHESSVATNGQIGNSKMIGLKRKATNQNSAEMPSESNGVGPMVGNFSEIRTAKISKSIPMIAQGLANGPKPSESTETGNSGATPYESFPFVVPKVPTCVLQLPKLSTIATDTEAQLNPATANNLVVALDSKKVIMGSDGQNRQQNNDGKSFTTGDVRN